MKHASIPIIAAVAATLFTACQGDCSNRNLAQDYLDRNEPGWTVRQAGRSRTLSSVTSDVVALLGVVSESDSATDFEKRIEDAGLRTALDLVGYYAQSPAWFTAAYSRNPTEGFETICRDTDGNTATVIFELSGGKVVNSSFDVIRSYDFIQTRIERIYDDVEDE